MFDKLEEVVARYEELNQMLVSPEVLADSKKMIECNKAINEITEIVEKYKEYKKYVDDIEFIKEKGRRYFPLFFLFLFFAYNHCIFIHCVCVCVCIVLPKKNP